MSGWDIDCMPIPTKPPQNPGTVLCIQYTYLSGSIWFGIYHAKHVPD